MIVSELLRGVPCKEVVGDKTVDIVSLTFDSRAVSEGSCFFAVEGTVVDGHNFIAGAVESISALLTTPKPLTPWIRTNCGKFFKRWEYQTT